MAAGSLDELIAALGDDATAANFARDFLKRYAATAFGILPKSEIDLLVFGLLVQAGAIDLNGPIYATARALNVTPAKARTLIFQHQLRTVPQAETEQAVLLAVSKGRYWKDGDRLAFGVESPLVRAAIAAKMREQGVFSDISLSGDILRVDPAQFGAFVAALLSKADAQALIKSLKKKGVVDEKGVRKAISEYGTKLAEDALKDMAKDAAKEHLGDFLGLVGRLAAEHGPDVVDALGQMIG